SAPRFGIPRRGFFGLNSQLCHLNLLFGAAEKRCGAIDEPIPAAGRRMLSPPKEIEQPHFHDRNAEARAIFAARHMGIPPARSQRASTELRSSEPRRNRSVRSR